MVESNNVELTEQETELYDRQIRLWGLDSQKRIRAARILLCGLSGLGAEIAKNIILAGIKSITFLDHKVVTELDAAAQFFAPHEAVNTNRAIASIVRAQALNPMVEITADPDNLSNKAEEFFENFDVVIVTKANTKELRRVNNICRSKNVKFLSADCWGMFGYCFADLLHHEFVEDVVKHKIINKPNEKTKTELIKTQVKRSLEFNVIDKMLEFNFKSEEYLKTLRRKGPALLILYTLLAFKDEMSNDPCTGKRAEDINKLLEIRNKMGLESHIPDNSYNTVFGQVSPACAIIGGEVAQEIIKAVSHNEAPHHNLFLFDPERSCGFIESLP